ncbi:MAG: TonB-dependent receptor plug domain-containing protein [Deltaproteobacteria bacterium]|nr:TonB-dependent receptor plug domain-containing protein [Deltaproteobacteria bacterium]
MSVLTRLAIVCLLARVAHADDDAPLAAATSTTIDRATLDDAPNGRPIDLLRDLPGVYALFVAGGGQADRLLVRGYDARQGTELNIVADGVPMNAPGHAVDHGYANTHVLIPDAIQSLTLLEGPYAARYGDFATAGTLEVRTLDAIPGGGAQVRLTSGSELAGPLLSRRLRRLFYRLTGLASPDLSRGRALLAAEVGIADGPYTNPQRMRRGAMMGTYTLPLDPGELRLHVDFFSGRYTESGLLPEDEVRAGRLGAYSAEDPTQGGDTMRASASVALTTRDRHGAVWHLDGYLVKASDRIFTNHSIFLRDAQNGDQLEHVDDRTTYGAHAYYRRSGIRIGVQARADDANVGLWHDQRRRRLDACFEVDNPCTLTAAHVRDLAVYVEAKRNWRGVAVEPGVRLDQLTWDDEDLDPQTATSTKSLTATAARARISPKLGVTFPASSHIAVLLRGGGGFRSSDTRATAATGAIRAIPRVWAGDAGIVMTPDAHVRAAASAYASWQQEEVAWVPDVAQAVTVPASWRYGVETRVDAHVVPWLALDASLSLARRAGTTPTGLAADVAPLFPALIAKAGATAMHRASFVTLRALGLEEDVGATRHENAVLVTLVAGHRWRSLELDVQLDNLLNRSDEELALPGGVRPSRVAAATTDILATPTAPLTGFITLGYVAR